MFNGPLTQAELVQAKEAAEKASIYEERRRELLLKAQSQRHTLKNRS